ncbi:hypothetical protein DRJ17_00525 [Candidatus Woesearchaeota archaeon]|nr:MAG: hypothetical protein DRJ17_00525 [Candidatus Woesearchaeota archaeon]
MEFIWGPELDKVVIEGLKLIDKIKISGFNIEDDLFLNEISIHVKYYHSVKQHIDNIKQHLQTEFFNKDKVEYVLREHLKDGLFKWEKRFKHQEDYKYIVLIKKGQEHVIKRINYDETFDYIDTNLVMAVSKNHVLTYTLDNDYILNFLEILINSTDPSMSPVNDWCDEVPLIVFKDKQNIITLDDKLKNNFGEAINIKFIKDKYCIQSLQTTEKAEKALKRLVKYECDFRIEKERRLVNKKFLEYLI